uniref:Uncharacterized protein LOC114334247 n=1 Tax=Diabrotica virgifera virgifera TaxID=50390 RepID=A0A6P7G6E2_DIAVI
MIEQTFFYWVILNNLTLHSASETRDLGVILDSALSYKSHIYSTIQKSMKMLGFIKRTTRDFTNISAIKSLYFSLVRSHFDYCSTIWSPYYFTHKLKIEAVQHNFLRYTASKLHVYYDYSVLERILNLPPLEVRRKQRDLIILFKIINGLCNCPELLSKISLFVPSRSTRQVQTFYVSFHRFNYSYNTFIPRTLRLANSLNNLEIFNISVSRFKNLISSLTF